jgi:hypothetical protein
METLLRIAAQPSASIKTIWWPASFRGEIGWGELMRSTLMSYICLNVFFLKPETYDAAARAVCLQNEHREPPTTPEDLDYRKTKGYVKMLRRCTSQTAYDVHLYPHREFFGIYPDRFSGHSFKDNNFAMPEAQNPHVYMPLRSDIAVVIRHLQQKGLPLELSLDVLDHAEYIPRRRLPIPEDPLHRENTEELRNYLKYCWRILIWCNVLAEGIGKKINWVYEVTQCILDLWGVDELKRKRIPYHMFDPNCFGLQRSEGFSFI